MATLTETRVGVGAEDAEIEIPSAKRSEPVKVSLSSGGMCDTSVETVQRESVTQLSAAALNADKSKQNMAAPMQRDSARKEVVNIKTALRVSSSTRILLWHCSSSFPVHSANEIG